MNEHALDKLRSLSEELEKLAPYPWERVEEWIASTRPLIRAHYSKHLSDFSAVTAAPEWFPRVYGVPSRYDETPRDERAEEAEADREDRAIARRAKRRILGFVKGLLDLPVPAVKNARTTMKPREQRTNKEGSDSMNKVKTLFVAANPTNTSRLAIAEEFRDIQEKIRAAEHRDAFEMIVAPAARPDDIEQALLQHKPVIVHFSGHGSDAGGLVFHEESGRKAKLVNARALGELFRLLKKNVRIVVLNACYSKAQAKAIVREIDFVVGMKDTISDLAARKFAASFYRGLGFGQTISTAFGLGVNALKREGLVDDENVPVLLVRSGISADVVLLDFADGKRLMPEGSSAIEVGSRPQSRRNASVGAIPIVIDGDDYMRRLLNIKIDAVHLARQVSCRALMQLLNARLATIPGVSGACESVEFLCSKRRIGSGGRTFSATQRSALLNRIGGEVGVYVEATGLTSKEIVTSIGTRIEDLAGSANCVVLVSSEPRLAPILRKNRHLKVVVLDLYGDLPNELRNEAYAALELENDVPGLFSYSYSRFDIRKLDEAACAELYAEADDNHHNQLRVTRDGTVFMSKDDVGAENVDNLRFRFETYCAGNGYVGPVVASKPPYVQEQLADIRNAWETGRRGYIDY
ncbi:CHAT domain-containing protein [Sorangium sp. So ce448]|uniref:CHAT domain-containing protein n=1 Tax=Sorangium sp. So ce448 TaxID=3133314 RepID=UPI003F600738